MRHALYVLFAPLVWGCPALAQAPASPTRDLQSSSLLNPNVSVIGWLQAESGNRQAVAGGDEPRAFELKEAEIGLQSVVDPYARADFFVSVAGDGRVDLEEGYLTWHTLPLELALKAGKFRHNFGRFNRIHTPETPFADRPLVAEKFFGEEGLSGVGVSLSWHVPNPWLFVNLDAEATTAPEAGEAPAFGRARRKEPLYVSRLSAYQDLTEALNLTLGGSWALGPAGQLFDPAANSTHTLKSTLQGLDLTVRWKDPARAIYRSLLWQTELVWGRRDTGVATRGNSFGWFSHLDWQYARRWHAGTRYDWSGEAADGSSHESGGLAYLTFTPSEFSLISLQGRAVERSNGLKERAGLLKITFNIGPHGAHPF